MPLSTITGYSDGYTLLQLRERIAYNLGMVAAGVVSYSRFPATIMNNVINEVQREVAVSVPTIRKVCIVNSTANKGWYLCPMMMIPKGIAAAYFYDTTTSYEKLKIYDRDRIDEEYDGWKTADSGTPEIIVPGMQMYGNRFTFEVYPAPDTSGSWTVQPTGVYLGGAPATTTTSVTGIATGGNTTTLTNTTIDFTTLGLAAGMVVWDVTDSGYGSILTIAAHTLTLSAAMTNAASFGAGDSYEIITDFTGVISDWDDDDEQYIFSSELGEISDLQPQANNILLEYYSYPINLSIDGDYPQMPKTLQDVLIDLSTARLARMGHEKTRQNDLAAEYELHGRGLLQPYVGATHGQPFSNMSRHMRVRFK
jgi:hypothetical protein